MVLDARVCNKLFQKPPTTLLGNMETWGRLETEPSTLFFVAQEDVKDYFYRLGNSRSVGECFAFPAVQPSLLASELTFMPPRDFRPSPSPRPGVPFHEGSADGFFLGVSPGASGSLLPGKPDPVEDPA